MVEKPVDLEQLRRDEGWYIAGNDLLHLEATDDTLGNIITAPTGAVHLTGNSVPETLKAVEKYAGNLGHIEKSDNLQDLAVYGDARQQRLKVDGDADSIHVKPELVWFGKNKSEHEASPDDLAATDTGYRRIPEGWIEINPKHLEDYRKACEDLRSGFGDLEQIRGTQIPETSACSSSG